MCTGTHKKLFRKKCAVIKFNAHRKILNYNIQNTIMVKHCNERVSYIASVENKNYSQTRYSAFIIFFFLLIFYVCDLILFNLALFKNFFLFLNICLSLSLCLCLCVVFLLPFGGRRQKIEMLTSSQSIFLFDNHYSSSLLVTEFFLFRHRAIFSVDLQNDIIIHDGGYQTDLPIVVICLTTFVVEYTGLPLPKSCPTATTIFRLNVLLFSNRYTPTLRAIS